MDSLLAGFSWSVYWLVLFGVILVRYVLAAGAMHLLLYTPVSRHLPIRSLRRKPPSAASIRLEFRLSVISSAVFASVGTIMLVAYMHGMTLLYTEWTRYSAWYVPLSFLVVLFLQDTYFYFTHRLFHHPALFRRVHWGHHRSGDPTPWSSFAFDPPEAVVHALFMLGAAILIPMHFVTLLAVLTTMTVSAVVNHLGFEFLPRWFGRNWFTRWLIGPTHHAYHHRWYRMHYGLYFTFWDRVLGTQDESYASKFDAPLGE